MALTHFLKNKQSPVRQFLDEAAPRLSLAGSRGGIGFEVAREFRFHELTIAGLVVPIPDGVEDRRAHAAPVGTAFDYRARMMLGGFDAHHTLALKGLQYFQQNTKGVRRGRHMVQVLADAFELANEQALSGDEIDRDRLAVVLAWCETFYRAGIYSVTQGSLGKQLRKAESGAALLQTVEPLMLTDLAELRANSEQQIEHWRIAVAGGARFEPNPDFSGSSLMGGADADWMVGDALIDCKTSERLTNFWLRTTLFQLLGYALLDFEDSLSIRQVGIWLPRRRALQLWSLDELLQRPAEEALPQLREDFQNTLEAWHEEMAARYRAERERMAEWRIAMEAEQEARAAAEAVKAEERRAKRREADRRRREAKRAAAAVAAS